MKFNIYFVKMLKCPSNNIIVTAYIYPTYVIMTDGCVYVCRYMDI